jgi:hypothetical protein
MDSAFEETYEKYREYLLSEKIIYKKTVLGIIDILGFKHFLEYFEDEAPKNIK